MPYEQVLAVAKLARPISSKKPTLSLFRFYFSRLKPSLSPQKRASPEKKKQKHHLVQSNAPTLLAQSCPPQDYKRGN
jgi:hypothetical protein